MNKGMIEEDKIIVNQKKSNLLLRMTEKCQNPNMLKKNIKEINTQDKITNKANKKEPTTGLKNLKEVMIEEIIREKTNKIIEESKEEMKLNTEIKKDQEVSQKLNHNKIEVKANKEEDTIKIIVVNLKWKTITSKRISSLNLKISKITCMLEEKPTLISFMNKSELNSPNITLLGLKQLVAKLLELSNWLKIFSKIFQISKESTFLVLLRLNLSTLLNQTKEGSSNLLKSQRKQVS